MTGSFSYSIFSRLDLGISVTSAVLTTAFQCQPTPQTPPVRLAVSDVLVNGAATRQAALGLGDRVEIGEAVFVVGRAAADKQRPASAPQPARRGEAWVGGDGSGGAGAASKGRRWDAQRERR